MLRYLSRFALLTLAFSFATAGLLGWQADGFRWPTLLADETLLRLEPLYLLILGIAIVPPTLWDIFQLEAERTSKRVMPSSQSAAGAASQAQTGESKPPYTGTPAHDER